MQTARRRRRCQTPGNGGGANESTPLFGEPSSFRDSYGGGGDHSASQRPPPSMSTMPSRPFREDEATITSNRQVGTSSAEAAERTWLLPAELRPVVTSAAARPSSSSPPVLVAIPPPLPQLPPVELLRMSLLASLLVVESPSPPDRRRGEEEEEEEEGRRRSCCASFSRECASSTRQKVEHPPPVVQDKPYTMPQRLDRERQFCDLQRPIIAPSSSSTTTTYYRRSSLFSCPDIRRRQRTRLVLPRLPSPCKNPRRTQLAPLFDRARKRRELRSFRILPSDLDLQTNKQTNKQQTAVSSPTFLLRRYRLWTASPTPLTSWITTALP